MPAADAGRVRDFAVPEGRMTVVIVTRNRRAELMRTLDRITALPERPPVIVVDNGSGDGSAEAASRYPGVAVIRAGQNLGGAAVTSPWRGRPRGTWRSATTTPGGILARLAGQLTCWMPSPRWRP